MAAPSGLDIGDIPLGQWGLVQLVTGLTVALTPAQSALRPAAAAVVVALACSFQSKVSAALGDTRAGGPLAAMCWVNVLNAMDLLVLRRVSFEAQTEWERRRGDASRKDTVFSRLSWSMATAFNYRRINTPWQIDKLPMFDEKDPSYVPSRWGFVLLCLAKVVLAVLLLKAFIIDANDPYLPAAIAELSESRSVLIPWVRATSARRIIVQALFTISFGVVCRSAILAGYNLIAMVAVGLGIYEPSAWPPIAGSLRHAYSLRRLWGSSWHQILRELLVSNADMISTSVLRNPPDSKWASYPRLMLAFAMSGLFHAGMDVAFGVKLEKSGALWFFVLQGLGVLFEGVFLYLCKDWIRGLSPRVSKAGGFVWVAAFQLWAVPVWMNPMVHALFVDRQGLFSPFLCFPCWVFERVFERL